MLNSGRQNKHHFNIQGIKLKSGVDMKYTLLLRDQDRTIQVEHLIRWQGVTTFFRTFQLTRVNNKIHTIQSLWKTYAIQ